ncbi:hypothetical protein XENOCAPTIV_018307 [Xenoophorus captivus]|uniref:Uncharacterized protein n=1 Tax=Xenoophorus captivus TaxID=1517983 RepID=A0ABV0R100_9TELE
MPPPPPQRSSRPSISPSARPPPQHGDRSVGFYPRELRQRPSRDFRQPVRRPVRQTRDPVRPHPRAPRGSGGGLDNYEGSSICSQGGRHTPVGQSIQAGRRFPYITFLQLLGKLTSVTRVVPLGLLLLPPRRDLLSQLGGRIWHPDPQRLRLWASPLGG